MTFISISFSLKYSKSSEEKYYLLQPLPLIFASLNSTFTESSSLPEKRLSSKHVKCNHLILSFQPRNERKEVITRDRMKTFKLSLFFMPWGYSHVGRIVIRISSFISFIIIPFYHPFLEMQHQKEYTLNSFQKLFDRLYYYWTRTATTTALLDSRIKVIDVSLFLQLFFSRLL